jgi:ribosomal protein L16 Arg81 hydroxylase
MACHGADLLEGDEKHVASQYMNNTSTIPLLRSDTTSDDLASKYPHFKQHVWPHCSETVLEPGDLLVMPPGWWHAMRGEGSGPGWSVSMWY